MVSAAVRTRGVDVVIRHIVLFSAKDPADVETILEGLGILKDIPGSRHFEVACNSKRDGLIVYGEFDSYEALDAYKAHPFYQESTRRVRPLRELRYAVDFEAAVTGASPRARPKSDIFPGR
jgi:hypothetical protein